jgi:hypothetical protein
MDARETDPEGEWVTYADHVAAVAEAEIRGLMKGEVTGPITRAFYEQGQRDGIRLSQGGDICQQHRAQGQRDAIAKAVAAVEGLYEAGAVRQHRAMIIAAIKAVGDV